MIKEMTDDPYTNRLLRSTRAKDRVKGVERMLYRGPMSAVMTMCKDRSKAVRRCAVLVISSLDDSLDYLVSLLHSSKDDVRDAAVDSLLEAAIDDEKSVIARLIQEMSDDYPLSREYAMLTLSHISPSLLIPTKVFIDALDDDCNEVVVNALIGLTKYGDYLKNFNLDLYKITDLLDRDDENISIHVFNLLGNIGEGAADVIDLINNYLTGEDSLVVMAAEKAAFLINKDQTRPLAGLRRAAKEVRNYVINNGIDELSTRKIGRLMQDRSGMTKSIKLCRSALSKIKSLVADDPKLLENRLDGVIEDMNNAILAVDN